MNRFKWISIIVGVISLSPLLFNTSFMWDGIFGEIAFYTQDTFFIKPFLTTQFIKYYVSLALNELSLVTGVNPKTYVNLITVISVCGMAYETFKLLKKQFHFEESVSYYGAWIVLAFPVWHSLASGITFLSILCVWFFMIAVNMWRDRPLLALLFFIPSLQFFSLFSFAVGFAGVYFLLTVEKGNIRQPFLKSFLFCFVLLASFIVIYKYGNIHHGGDYNTFNADRLDAFAYFGVFLVITLGATFVTQRYITDQDERTFFIRCMLAFITLAFFAGLPYWAVGRPLRFFSFGSFTSRFTYLTCIPFALLLATIGHFFARRFKPKTITLIAAFILTALLVLQHQGHSHKAAAVLFKDMLTYALQHVEEPPSGYVAVNAVDYQAPRHVQQHAINMCFYQAFGKAAWMANGFWRQRGRIWDKASLQEIYDLPKDKLKFIIANDVTGDAFTHYRFHLDGYHQEGRFWYWWYYLTSDYNAFNPRLELVEQYK